MNTLQLLLLDSYSVIGAS